jgi:hypothetical protein
MAKPLTPKQQKLADALHAAKGAPSPFEPAVVDGVSPNLTVLWRGTAGVRAHLLVAYASASQAQPTAFHVSYTALPATSTTMGAISPKIGDVVLVIKQGSQLVILGRLI